MRSASGTAREAKLVYWRDMGYRYSTLLQIVYMTLWSLIYFSGVTWLLQLLAFGGHVFSVHFPLLLIILILLALILSRKKIHASILANTWMIYFLITVIGAAVVSIGYGAAHSNIKTVVLFAISSLLPYLLVSLSGYCNFNLSQAIVLKFIFLFGIISISIAMVQSLNGYHGLMREYLTLIGSKNFIFYGLTRPISIFSVIGTYGSFLAFLASIASCYLAVSDRKKFFSKLIMASLIGLSFLESITFTRTSYVLFVMIIIASIIFYKMKKLFRILPLVSFIVGGILYLSAPYLSQVLKSSAGSIAADSSVFTRYHEAGIYIGIVFRKLLFLIFGPGMNALYLTNNGIYVDNAYIAILLQSGVLGLLVFVFVFMVLWKKLLYLALDDPSPLRVSIAAFVGVSPCIGFFDVDNSYLLFAALGLSLSSIRKSDQNRA